MTARSFVAPVRTGVLAVSLVLVSLVGFASPTVSAQTNPFQRGPNPTSASIEAPTGPFAIAQTSVAAGNGFGGGTIYYPTSTAEGTFGAIALSPGFFSTQSAVAWLGPRLASQGFVVFTINTNSGFDFPSSRATQLMAALNYLTNTSSVRTRIDATRLAVGGHSMGGGGTLIAAQNNPTLQAALPLAPWNTSTNFSGVRVPTMIVGCESDSVAPVASHAEPFYNSIPAASEKAYLEINNGSHSCPTSSNTTIARSAISWLKRFVDNDTRYEQFLCPPPPPSSTINEYRNTCPSA
jgi:predicted dienelactone hydrolase